MVSKKLMWFSLSVTCFLLLISAAYEFVPQIFAGWYPFCVGIAMVLNMLETFCLVKARYDLYFE